MRKQVLGSIINAIISLIMAIVLIKSLFNYEQISWNIYTSYMHTIVILIFGYEYIYGLVKSENIKKYFKSNIIDLLAIIPMYIYLDIFKLLNIDKLLTLSRLIDFIIVILIGIYLFKFKNIIKPIWTVNRIYYMILLTTIIILVGALLISIVEEISLGDALWWSFVTFTTVGYGDVTLYTTFGRVVGVILMILGIGVIGVLTSTIAVMIFFGGNKKNTKVSYKEEIFEDAIERLNKFDQLSNDDLDDIFKVLKSIKKEK